MGRSEALSGIRRRLENAINDHLYDRLEGTTNSELLFLLMLQEGLDADPAGAIARTAARVVEASRQAGMDPDLRLTAALSDGETLYAVRYATDAFAPTLYAGATRAAAGRCLVSEPFDRDGGGWKPIPPGSFVTVTRDAMSVTPFVPTSS